VTRTTPVGLSSREVGDLLNVSYRQLHLWVTRGWIPGLAPAGSGNEWRWSLVQVRAAQRVRDHLEDARVLLADPTRCPDPARCTHPTRLGDRAHA
jgi:hypothetical protein